MCVAGGVALGLWVSHASGGSEIEIILQNWQSTVLHFVMPHAAQHTQLDAAILLLICTGGIPPTVVDSQEWWCVLIIATNSKYRPPSSDTLVDSLIPSEAAHINEQVLKVLTSDSINYATIGFDGGATAGWDSFTTVHATTSDRCAFFLDGKSTTNIKHTGECYAGIIKTVSIILRHTILQFG